jgi:hypothetical protein
VSSGMDNIIRKNISIAVVVLLSSFIIGCKTPHKPDVLADLGNTVGTLVEVILPEYISVEGYGLVGGLKGTGSSECPAEVRSYLSRYIMKQLPEGSVSQTNQLINSLNTAVVLVEGIMPIEDAQSNYFDLKVTALQGTQTTSLENGWLFTSELKVVGSFGIKTDVLADAEGPVFINQIDDSELDRRTGRILAGGKILREYKIVLILHKSDYELTHIIRNRLNQRFGPNVANAVMAGRVEIIVPDRYKYEKSKFISMVKSMYLTETPEVVQRRINVLAEQLSVSPQIDDYEFALETIGRQSLGALGVLLGLSDEHVRLRAARCMINLGNDSGLEILRQVAMNRNSDYRVEAIEAIAKASKKVEAASVIQRLLYDEDFGIRLTAYEQLRKLNDFVVKREAVGRSFFLEQITQAEKKEIYVTRSGRPRILLFGTPLYCDKGIFIQSKNGEITINSPPGQEYVSLIRKHLGLEGGFSQMRSSFELGDIIRTLCEEPPGEDEEIRGGLGVSYADMIAILKQMCDKGAIDAAFHAGHLPKNSLNIKK